MKIDRIDLLSERSEIHDYVKSLWTAGPIAESHRSGGMVHDIVDRFASVPRFFYEPSEPDIEWTHFSTWWGGILLCDYDNPHIRDLRYLHEIYHAATLPYVPRRVESPACCSRRVRRARSSRLLLRR